MVRIVVTKLIKTDYKISRIHGYLYMYTKTANASFLIS